MQALALRTKSSFVKGFQAGFKTWWWLLKIMLPITLGVTLLQWSGAISVVSGWLTPVFSHIGLTGEGVLVFITGCLASIYAAIGVMGTLALDYRSVVILAVMSLIAHNLIVESVIQRKAGGGAVWKFFVVRIAFALLAAAVMNRILPVGMTGTLLLESRAADTSFGGLMSEWAMTNLKLLPLMFGIIVSLNILQQLLREFRLIEYLTLPVAPLMSIFGLSRKSSFLWIVLNTLGLTYGGSVMISEVESGTLSRREAKLLNAHAAINHSLLEDTLLYVAIGIGVFWLIIPRVLLAIVWVWALRLKEWICDN